MKLKRVRYSQLNLTLKANYNFLKIAAILADYGWSSTRLGTNWRKGEFIVQHVKDEKILKMQLRAYLTFSRRFIGKNVHIVFQDRKGDGTWYIYPHDKLLKKVSTLTNMTHTRSWRRDRWYDFQNIPKRYLPLLKKYAVKPID